MSYRKSIDSYKILRKFYREFLAGQPAHGIHALLAVPVQNVTAHPSTASAPVIVLGLLCNGPLLCDVPIKGLRQKTM